MSYYLKMNLYVMIYMQTAGYIYLMVIEYQNIEDPENYVCRSNSPDIEGEYKFYECRKLDIYDINILRTFPCDPGGYCSIQSVNGALKGEIEYYYSEQDKDFKECFRQQNTAMEALYEYTQKLLQHPGECRT